jgi:Na+-driven multidrug efflux pump
MMIQSSVLRVNEILAPGSVYEPVVDGNASVANLNGFIYTATNSVCQASIAFTSQNVGAGKYERVKKVLVNCYAITCAVAVISSLTLLVFNHQLLSLYGITDGEGLAGIAYNAAMTKMRYETLTYFLLAFMEVGCGVLRGLGKSLTSTVITLVGACLLRVVWILTVFEHFLTLESIYISYPISWAVTGVVALVFVIILLRKQISTAKAQVA